VTSTNATTAAKLPQTSPSPTNQTAASPMQPPSSSAGSTNQAAATQQSSNTSSANPLSKIPVIGKLFGGK
jgi:hypothetical protein